MFAAKSSEGSLAFYDLDKMVLLKKITYTYIGAQDEGFAFSPNVKYFYNVEKRILSTRTQLTVYDTRDFQEIKALFRNDESMFLECLELDESIGKCYVSGFIRGTDGVIENGFVGILESDNIVDLKSISIDEHDYISAYKSWERSGFTEKFLEWSPLKTYKEKPHIALKKYFDN